MRQAVYLLLPRPVRISVQRSRDSGASLSRSALPQIDYCCRAFLFFRRVNYAERDLQLVTEAGRPILQRDDLTKLFCRVEQNNAPKSFPGWHRDRGTARLLPQEGKAAIPILLVRFYPGSRHDPPAPTRHRT